MTERCPFAVLDWEWKEAGYIVYRLLPNGLKDIAHHNVANEKGYVFFHDKSMALKAQAEMSSRGEGLFLMENMTMERAREESKSDPRLTGVWVVDMFAKKHFVCTK